MFPNQQQTMQATVFLDLTDRVRDVANEEGLLGMAFDPRFGENGYFYVYYSASEPRRSILSRYLASRSDGGVADVDSELIIMEISQPAGNHNGGQLAFGPDGYLYLALGDGGLGGDPFQNGQNKSTLLGSILRVDVSEASVIEKYRIPPDNPLFGVADARQEIWAYGLRNPWRFSFEWETGTVWAGDAGQNRWEEIDLIEKGLNYGWNIMEGAHCFTPSEGCDQSGLQLPLAEYSSAVGCAVIGGYVYRGAALPSLRGIYVYGDFCSGEIWGLRYDGRLLTGQVLLSESGLSIRSFGQDRAGNLFILSRDSGIYRLILED